MCTSDNGFVRECVPYYLCIDGKINRNGTNVINIRFGGGQKCIDYFEECCIIEIQETFEVDYEIKEEQKSLDVPCGMRKMRKLSYKITENDDGEADFGEFSWMIAILRGELLNFLFIFGIFFKFMKNLELKFFNSRF